MALSSDGRVYSWGTSKSGNLGLGDIRVRSEPTVITFPPEVDVMKKHSDNSNLTKIKAISCGSSHCLALSSNRKVFSWGNGQGGRLGHGDQIDKNTPTQIRFGKDLAT